MRIKDRIMGGGGPGEDQVPSHSSPIGIPFMPPVITSGGAPTFIVFI